MVRRGRRVVYIILQLRLAQQYDISPTSFLPGVFGPMALTLRVPGVGIFQDYYQTHNLRQYSSSEIAWIPSLQIFFMLACVGDLLPHGPYCRLTHTYGAGAGYGLDLRQTRSALSDPRWVFPSRPRGDDDIDLQALLFDCACTRSLQCYWRS